MNQTSRRDAGFTLAELLVSTTMVAIIMGAAYVAFNSAIRTWRTGSTDFQVYQDARIATCMLERDIQAIIPGAGVFMEGESDSIGFYALVPPMQSKEGNERRLMWVSYRLKRDSKRPGSILMREERVVNGPLPVQYDMKQTPQEFFALTKEIIIDLDREESFQVATGVESLRFMYYWMPPADENTGIASGDAPIAMETNPMGRGLPKAIGVELTMHNPDAIREDVHARARIVFRAPTPAFDKALALEAAGDRL
jgi:prepilin-type N-terminal cleavage/methylation domain-containing protein